MNLRMPFLATLSALSWLTVMVWNEAQWLTQFTDLAWLAKDSVKTVMHVAIWIAGWSWVTYVNQGGPRLSEHICIATAASLLDVAAFQVVLPGIFFALAWPWPMGFYKILWMPLLLVAGLLHLRVAANGLNRRQIGGWALVSALALSLSNLQGWAERNDREALKRLPYEPNIYPAAWVITPADSLDEGIKGLWANDWAPKPPKD